MSSARMDWETPPDLVRGLEYLFGRFDLDVCATPETAKARRYFTPEDDGLAQPWEGTCFMNPPYGKEIAEWMRKAWAESKRGATVVCLLPVRTSSKWWRTYVTRADQVIYMAGRVRFVGAESTATFGSAVVVFQGWPS